MSQRLSKADTSFRWLHSLTIIVRALICLYKGPETGGFSLVLGAVGFVIIFMNYGNYGDDDQLMKVPMAVVVSFLFAYVCELSVVVSDTFSSV